MPWRTPRGAGATVHIWNGYSLAERDRRWNAVRENSARAGFDCILVPLGNGTDGRYMTQLRCSAMALPTDGRAPIIVADRSSRNEWVPEPWQTGREWAEPMGEALLDLGMHHARVGVVGLKGGTVTHSSSIDGVVNHRALELVMGKVPKATFVDGTDIVGMVRFVKSAEEITFVRESANVATAGLKELIKLARPGIDAGELYADVLTHMLALRSEYFPLQLTVDSIDVADPKRYSNPPIGRRLGANTLLINEINAIRGAELTQVCQPILLGKVPQSWEPVIALQKEVHEAGMTLIKPGTTFGALSAFVSEFGRRRGMRTAVGLQGCGYGDDGPLITVRAFGEAVQDLAIQAGNVFIWKPMSMLADGKIKFSSGGPVIVTNAGCEALFKPAHGIVTIQ